MTPRRPTRSIGGGQIPIVNRPLSGLDPVADGRSEHP